MNAARLTVRQPPCPADAVIRPLTRTDAKAYRALWKSLEPILKTISPNECVAYLANAGYST
jgi:hypothetical protein